jgi:hypothetical protein
MEACDGQLGEKDDGCRLFADPWPSRHHISVRWKTDVICLVYCLLIEREKNLLQLAVQLSRSHGHVGHGWV